MRVGVRILFGMEDDFAHRSDSPQVNPGAWQRLRRLDERRESASARSRVVPDPALTGPAASLDTPVTVEMPLPEQAVPGPSKVRFDRRHVTVIAFVVAFGAVIAGFTVLRTREVPMTAPVAAVTTQHPGATVSPGNSSASPAQSLRVHVIGAVRTPGVVTVPSGSRVIDAVEAAGGLIQTARVGELNLAQPLTDGEQILVGDAVHPGGQVRPAGGTTDLPGGPAGGMTPASAGTSGSKVNLNSATTAQLDTLPGVGPVTAEKIVAWRTQHGRFTKVEELQEVPGIGPKSFSDIKPHVTV